MPLYARVTYVTSRPPADMRSISSGSFRAVRGNARRPGARGSSRHLEVLLTRKHYVGGSTMTLVGRKEETTVLRRMFADVQCGRGGVIIVTGSAALGKTGMLHAAAEHALQSGARWLSATACSSEQALPLGVMSQLLRSAPLDAPATRRAEQLLREGAVPAADGPDAAEGRSARIHQGLCEVLLTLAAETPLVITVDDVHQADTASMRCLSHLTRRLRSARIMVVLSKQLEAEPDLTPYTDMSREPHVGHLGLRPLTESDVAALLGRRFDDAAARRLAPAVLAVSGGNPLLATVLADATGSARAGRTGRATVPGEPVVDEMFRQAVLTCLRRGDAKTGRVARALAVLDDAWSFDVLCRALDIDTLCAERAVRILEAAGLLVGGRFRHPAMRSATLDGMPAEERTRLHRRCARLLHDTGSPALDIARQLIGAGGAPDPEAVPVLREAAEQALAGDDAATAIRCLELAHRAALDNRQHVAVIADLARAELRVNLPAATRHLRSLLAPARDPQQRSAGVLAVIRRHLLWSVEERQAVEALRAPGPSGGTEDRQLAAERHLSRVWLGCTFPSLVKDLPACPAEPAPDGSTPATIALNPELLAATLLSTALRDEDGKDVVADAEHILQNSALSDHTFEMLAFAILALFHSDRLDKAAVWCRSLQAQAVARRAPTWQAVFAALQAQIALRQGELSAAEEHARAALRLIPRRIWGPFGFLASSAVALACTAMGKDTEAADQLSGPLPETAFDSLYGLYHLHARGQHHFANNRLQAALGDFLACGELMTDWGVDVPTLVPWRSAAAEVLIQLGDRARARELLDEQLARPRANGPRLRGTTLRLLAATVELQRRPALLTEAVEELQSAHNPYELARALADLGDAHRALGAAGRARMVSRQAWNAARHCQAEPLLRRLKPTGGAEEVDRPLRVQAGPADIASLSSAERRVATLATLGYTNREISRKLHITVSTVEQHLTRVYRKLNVRHRTEIPSDLDLVVDSRRVGAERPVG
ncbi:ATP-binding protein [Streptomyces lydicus]|uniref:ATP-binding protein n=1 Tax=Streptomyces lydicus TaxID=47763 RepID=UPI00379430E8